MLDRLKTRPEVREALRSHGFFAKGATFIVDGQFGSTGKGLMASVYAEAGAGSIDLVTTNAGPNSGHTAFCPGSGDKIMTQQIPVASVITRSAMLPPVSTYLNAGAIIDPDILKKEMDRWALDSKSHFAIHPNAAIIEQEDRDEEAGGSVAAIASTGKGVGAALARKVLRRGNTAGMKHGWWSDYIADQSFLDVFERDDHARTLVETAQGFSLGINGRFYPHTTSRECTALQAAADARIHWSKIKNVIACYRTYPIRVGNTDQGTSGSCYSDQVELRWEKLGIEPELTSVTKRVRRIFSWSRIQFRESLQVNRPNLIFLNFVNYLPEQKRAVLLEWIEQDCFQVLKHLPPMLFGFGPYNGDVRLTLEDE